MLNCDEFINADEIARGISPLNPEKASIEAGRYMIRKIETLIYRKKILPLKPPWQQKATLKPSKKQKIKDIKSRWFFSGSLRLNWQQNMYMPESLKEGITSLSR